MKKTLISGALILGISVASLFAFNNNTNWKESSALSQNVVRLNDKVTATITKNTTRKELEDLKEFFGSNGITFQIKKVKYNTQNEIVALSFVLKSENGGQSKYSSSSNNPISDLELGKRDGSLFIESMENHSGLAQLQNLGGLSQLQNLQQLGHMDIDSLMRDHGFTLGFDEEDGIFSINGQDFDIDEIERKMEKMFGHLGENGSFNFNFDFDEDDRPSTSANSNNDWEEMPKYNFVDDPDVNKLIMIDGKESTFEELDRLAKDDKLQDVDFLKASTAVSIYGDKAKDGAIIAITKE